MDMNTSIVCTQEMDGVEYRVLKKDQICPRAEGRTGVDGARGSRHSQQCSRELCQTCMWEGQKAGRAGTPLINGVSGRQRGKRRQVADTYTKLLHSATSLTSMWFITQNHLGPSGRGFCPAHTRSRPQSGQGIQSRGGPEKGFQACGPERSAFYCFCIYEQQWAILLVHCVKNKN